MKIPKCVSHFDDFDLKSKIPLNLANNSIIEIPHQFKQTFPISFRI